MTTQLYERMVVEGELAVPGVTFQIRNWTWPTPLETEFHTPDHVLLLSSSPRPRLSHGTYDPHNTRQPPREFGEMNFVPANAKLYSWTSGGPQRLAYFSFDPRRFQALCRFGAAWHVNDLEECFDIRDASVRHIMLQLAQEAAAPGFASGILVESLSTAIMIGLSRYLHRDAPGVLSQHGKLDLQHVRRIADYVEACPSASPTVSDLAALCGVSARHLMRVFKHTTGQSLSAYVEQIKTDKAKHLLAHADISLKEISFRLGFAHPANFSTAFKRVEGMTPLAYRKAKSVRSHLA